MSKINDLSLNEAIDRLKEIVAWFEGDDFDIEAAIVKFEEGSLLAADIKEKLSKLQNKVTVLAERFDNVE